MERFEIGDPDVTVPGDADDDVVEDISGVTSHIQDDVFQEKEKQPKKPMVTQEENDVF